MNDWKIEPLAIDEEGSVLNSADYLIAMDETGTQNLNGITNQTPSHNCMFTLTGIIIEKVNVNRISDDIMELKGKYWPSAFFNEHRVVFHSRNIRKRVGPFNPMVIDNDTFQQDLNNLLSLIPFEIISASIEKRDLKNRYSRPRSPYKLSVRFILERIAMKLNFHNSKGVILLESRGRKEDAELLSEIVNIIDNGSEYVKCSTFNCISGVYFNPKWNSNHDKSYWPLEIADIVSYRIHRHNLASDDVNELNFKIIEDRLIDYPKYQGSGNKIFPL